MNTVYWEDILIILNECLFFVKMVYIQVNTAIDVNDKTA